MRTLTATCLDAAEQQTVSSLICAWIGRKQYRADGKRNLESQLFAR
jgi:hypothetical protein